MENRDLIEVVAHALKKVWENRLESTVEGPYDMGHWRTKASARLGAIWDEGVWAEQDNVRHWCGYNYEPGYPIVNPYNPHDG